MTRPRPHPKRGNGSGLCPAAHNHESLPYLITGHQSTLLSHGGLPEAFRSFSGHFKDCAVVEPSGIMRAIKRPRSLLPPATGVSDAWRIHMNTDEIFTVQEGAAYARIARRPPLARPEKCAAELSAGARAASRRSTRGEGMNAAGRWSGRRATGMYLVFKAALQAIEPEEGGVGGPPHKYRHGPSRRRGRGA